MFRGFRYLQTIFHSNSQQTFELTASYIAAILITLIILLSVSLVQKAGDFSFLTPASVQTSVDILILFAACVAFLMAGVHVSEIINSHQTMLLSEIWKLEVKQQAYWTDVPSAQQHGKLVIQRCIQTLSRVRQMCVEKDEPPRLLSIELTSEFRYQLLGIITTVIVALGSYTYQVMQEHDVDPYGRRPLDYYQFDL